MTQYYCGPKGWPKFIKKRLSRYHNETCKLHDKDYQTRLKPRKEIDKDFLDRMLAKSWEAETPRLRKRMRRHAKWLHFWVRKFGGFIWIKKKGGQLTGYSK